MSDERIDELINELEGLGEDPEELAYWWKLVPDLTPEQKTELTASLEAEAIGLKRAAGMTISAEDEQRLAQDRALLQQVGQRDRATAEATRKDAAKELAERIKGNL